MTISSEQVRQLLDADGEATLVLIEGRAEVVTEGQLRSDQYQGALEVISRDELRKRTGGSELSDHELEEQAAMLNSAVDELGG
jgi:NADH dehydrogenase